MPLLTEEELGMDPTRVFELQDQIGEGSFGTVHRAIHLRTNTVVAIKILPTGKADLSESIKEITFMTGIHSEFLVEYYGSYLRDTELWIVMEYCGAGSVSDLMEFCNMTLSEDQISVVCRYALKGLAYMHSMRKIHRDIKAGNILINTRGEAKLADFGVSGQLSDASSKRQTVIGTPFWMAPEVIQEVGYGTPADIWSLGISCIEMADGRPPYHDIHPMRAIFIIPTKPPPRLEDEERYSKVFRSFVARCLTKDQKARPTAEELLNDPFIRRNPSINALSPLLAAVLDPRRGVTEYLSDPDDEVLVSSEMDEPTYLEETAAYPLQALDPGSRDTVLERNDGSGFGDEDYAIYEDYVQNDSRPTSPEQSDTLSTSAISVPAERPKRSYGIGFITRAIEYLSTSPPPNVSSILIPPGMPTPSAMKSGRTPSPGDSVRARKRSITDERLFMSLEDVKDAEIAAVKAKYQRRKQAVIDAILMKGGSV